jgi:hypothetical protein
MADLFTITAPLLVRHPDGTQHIMLELFRHPEGLVYFRTFWDRLPRGEGIRMLSGEVRGEGPWKIGDAVITVLGCHGSNPDEAAEYAQWQFHLGQLGEHYPDRDELARIAHKAGCLP